jgi:broad specificity phosphatase PhoE
MAIHITYFVHGTTTDNEKNISSGWKNVRLSKLGIKQSKELKNLIKGKKFEVVFCSDLKRAVDSANLTFKGKVRIIKDKRLRECNYGDLNGAKSNIVDSLTIKCISKPFPNGESYKDAKTECLAHYRCAEKRNLFISTYELNTWKVVYE